MLAQGRRANNMRTKEDKGPMLMSTGPRSAIPIAGKWLAQRATPLRNLLRDHAPRRQVGLHRRPCWKACGVAPRGPAADKALGEVSPRDVEMAKYAAKLAGGEQARDGLSKSVEDALLGVMHGTTMGVGTHWPHIGAVIGRRRDFQHGRRRAAMHRVFARLAR